jgi:hypothetical protein
MPAWVPIGKMAGRQTAESTYDWSVIGRRLANDVLRRVDKARWLRMQGRLVARQIVH